MTRSSAIARLLRPQSVAIVGASPTPGSLGGGVLGNLDRFAFKGAVHLVNPNRDEIGGRPCLNSVDDLPPGVDCAVLAIPRGGVIAALEACARRGVGGAIIFASGFAEAGEEGRALQARVAEIARASGMAIEGPNCLGMVNLVDGVPLTFGATDPMAFAAARHVAVVSQSGAMATVLRAALLAREVGVSLSVSTGNEAVNGIEDFLEELVADPTQSVIALVVEQFRQPQRFLGIARTARAQGKQMVLLHPGRSAAAKASAATHTGALTGDYEVMRALVSRAGVVVVDGLDALIDVCEIFIRARAPITRGAAIVTDSGAFKGLALDICEDVGLSLPAPGPEAAQTIGAIAPDLIFATNPLDLTAQALVDPDLYRKTMKPFLDDDRFGAVVLASIISNPTLAKRKLAPAIDAIRAFNSTKLIVLAMLGDEADVPPDIVDDFRALGVPFLRSPERAMRALAAIEKSARAQGPEAGQATPQAGARLPVGALAEYESKRLLAEAGVAMPKGGLARDAGEARSIAQRIGYPVAVKAQARALAHKSDAGGVMLNIRDAHQLNAAWEKLRVDIARTRPGLALDGALVEAMAKPGVELIIGARRDREWGLVLLIGFGGVLAEALRDVRVLAPDATAGEIIDAMRSLRAAPLLGAFRGAPARDLAAAAESLIRLAAFAQAHPEITEIEINPLVVFAAGEGALALDALIVVGDSAGA